MPINIAPCWRKFQLKYKKNNMKVWQCVVCGFIYDEVRGLPGEDIKPGTAWADIPDNWACPDCGVSKADFDMVEV
jgi:rubredoxin